MRCRPMSVIEGKADSCELSVGVFMSSRAKIHKAAPDYRPGSSYGSTDQAPIPAVDLTIGHHRFETAATRRLICVPEAAPSLYAANPCPRRYSRDLRQSVRGRVAQRRD